MAQIPITPRRVAPYVISGATGVHILRRMRRLSKQPASDIPLHFFLLKNTDVVLALGGASAVIWHLASRKPRQRMPRTTTLARSTGLAATAPDKSLIAGVVHELRQIFTALLLGLGLLKRRAEAGDTQPISGLVQRLDSVVRHGIDAVDMLEFSGSTNGREREYGA